MSRLARNVERLATIVAFDDRDHFQRIESDGLASSLARSLQIIDCKRPISDRLTISISYIPGGAACELQLQRKLASVIGGHRLVLDRTTRA
jgi:hypothetical protein